MEWESNVEDGKDGLKLVVMGQFKVPKLMKLWADKYIHKRSWVGRPKALILVGDPLTGKSKWAESFGRPIVMNSGWCMKSIYDVENPTHIVVSDVKPSRFGYKGNVHWQDVIGGKPAFNARDFQQEMRTITWNLPCIWTCNFDCDPRKEDAVADYIFRTEVEVVEIRDRGCKYSIGKLYEPLVEDRSVEEKEEWARAREEAKKFAMPNDVDAW
ncbi:hypothetical protein DL95DRAFT_463264 [Leptodontidium sp. 2 PMI_412]|nr:hypothetical protein DL95DRAFT_463264 [Leptodontidium sp. 2 PMI_412]